MAVQYIGTIAVGASTDTKPTRSSKENGLLFVETNTNKVFFQSGVDSWAEIGGADLRSGVTRSSLTKVGVLTQGSIASGFGSINIGDEDITTTGTITAGDLVVNGDTTTVSSTNTTITDRLIELASGAGSSTADAGIIVERGSTGDNAVIAWDESADKWIVGTTTATGSSTGDLTITTGTITANLDGAAPAESLSGDTIKNTITGSSLTSVGTLTSLVIANGGNIGSAGDLDAISISTAGVVTMNQIPVFSAGINVSGGTIIGTIDSSSAVQTNITSLGTLGILNVDNIRIDANTISSTAGTDLNITPLSGQQIVLDGTIIIDAGEITGATSITSTNFVGAIDGIVGGTTPAAITGTTITASTKFVGAIDGVLGGNTPAAISATSGTFSTTLGVTGNATFSGNVSLGDTVITNGVITDSTGLSIAAAVDLGSNTFTTTGLISGGDLEITGTSTTIGTVTSGVWNAGAITSSGAITSTAASGANSLTVNATTNDAYLVLNSDTDEGQDSEVIFQSGGTSRGRIEYNHNATAASQLLSFFVGDNVVEALTLKGDGNVGVGVAAPDQKLEVAGAIHMSGEISSPSAPSDGDGGIMYTKTDGKLYFISNETAEVELSSSGGGGGAGTAIAMAMIFG